ncbi:putative ethanolamine kinase [Helianthus annuus]|nr:putative ethanolamine kinase [Helianthus annuus]
MKMPGSKKAKVVLWPTMREWLIKAKGSIAEEQMDLLKKEVDFLEKEMSKGKQTLAFCHNDLGCRYIIVDEAENITIMDSECAGYNRAAYDIENYFSEWTRDDHVLDYERYPDLRRRKMFLRLYCHTPTDGGIIRARH